MRGINERLSHQMILFVKFIIRFSLLPPPRTPYLVPTFEVILIPGEAVDQKTVARILGGLHGTVEQAASDLHGYDRAVPDVSLDELAVHRSGFGALLAQEIASRQVHITVVIDDVAAKRALTGTRATEDEHNFRLLRRDGGHGRT